MGQKKETLAAPEKKDILGSMEHILTTSVYKKGQDRGGRKIKYYKFNDTLIESVESDASFLAEQFHLTPKQAVLFTIIIDLSKGESFEISDLFDMTEIEYIKALPIKGELRSLEKAMLIRKDSSSYKIPKDVVECLEKNQPYINPWLSNLSTANILSRMSR